jgi:hypothetical protein
VASGEGPDYLPAMFTKTFDEITKADIDRLVTDGIREGRQLDYKAELPGRTDKDKKELARDVTSFANAAGGYVIYGITDQKDAAGKNTGVPAPVTGLSGVNGEQEILRLEGMIRGNVDPGIPGVRMKAVDGFADGPVIILQIPKSWSAPHMVNVDKDSRFYSRGSGGSNPWTFARFDRPSLSPPRCQCSSGGSGTSAWGESSPTRPPWR